MRSLAPLATVALALALSGCRLHVDHVKEGTLPSPEKLVQLQPGKSTLDDALALLGAPDGLGWVVDEDMLAYDSWTVRSSHWEAENPTSYATGGISPQTLIGEIPTYVMFVNDRTGTPAAAPQSPILRPPPLGFKLSSKPLQLNGDARGHEEVRLFFNRETLLLTRVELTRGGPGAGVGGIAQSTFLK